MSPPTTAAALAQIIRRANTAHQAAVAALTPAVIRAKQAGWQWRVIADALGRHESNTSRTYRPVLLASPAPRRAPDLEETLAQLKAVRADIHTTAAERVRAVAAGLSGGLTWPQVAEALDRPRPSVIRSFAGQVERRVTVRPKKLAR